MKYRKQACYRNERKEKGTNLSPPQVIIKSLNPVHWTTYIRFSHDKEI